MDTLFLVLWIVLLSAAVFLISYTAALLLACYCSRVWDKVGPMRDLLWGKVGSAWTRIRDAIIQPDPFDYPTLDPRWEDSVSRTTQPDPMKNGVNRAEH